MMHLPDFIRLTLNAVRAQRLRSFLTALGIAVGIGSVVLLTSLGEGLHRFVLAEFTQFGTNLIGITPGKVTTHGIAGLLLGAGGVWLLGALVPALPTHTSWTYVVAAELLAAVVGLLAGVLPARRAASLNPVEALRAE